ncbi:hypothetical protein [Streptomyces abikoensis]|uniref:Uncharacterized protein n=1 Tax=Streptomyces abikoensis TaxID=97398 RepID=A0ABW7T9Y7_9ACTN
MNPKEEGVQARIFATALRTWAGIDVEEAPTAVRLEIREPPAWEYAGVINLTNCQQERILKLLRGELAENRPGYSSPERAAAVIQGLLTERRLAGRTHVDASDLVEAAPRIGRSRKWIAAHITELIEAGHLRETRRPARFRL